ncbi:hypothetical protein AB4161_22705 [Vibrio sp. 10N.286.51.E5]|uniref:hypothetical protein n=1 Tax=Vibrio sp. 10N.286.51.E5 TaxID=3229709 RepID=UPI0035503CB6
MNQSDSFGENTMTNENLTACLAKQFCDGLWDSYTKKYPDFLNRISPIFVHLAIYQHLVSQRSIIGSKGRQRQQELVESFEQWYEGIEHARAIDWIDLNLAALDTIQGNTGDYSYGFDAAGGFIRDDGTEQAWESSINHQLFQALPIVSSIVDANNHNKEIVRQIENLLSALVPFPITTPIPGELELLSLMVDDISRLLIGKPHDAGKAHALDGYLYLFQSAVLGSHRTKQECVQLAISIHERVTNIQNEGSVPRLIDSFWQMGFGYSDELVKDYNQLVVMLDSQVCTVHREDIDDGFELSVWRYPFKEQTQQKIILRGDGKFKLMGEKPLIFDDPRMVVDLLMSMASRDS